METVADHIGKPDILLKTGLHREPIYLMRSERKTDDGATTFCLCGSQSGVTVFGSDTSIEPAAIRRHIEPWLATLCQSNHSSLLVGTGLTYAVSNIANEKAVKCNPMPTGSFGTLEDKVDRAAMELVKKGGSGRKEVTFEDRIRVASEMLRGMEIDNYADSASRDDMVRLGKYIQLSYCRLIRHVMHLESSLHDAATVKQSTDAMDYLVRFLICFAYRVGVRDRLHIFTTNYDRLIEEGCNQAGIQLVDRFVGTLNPIFRSSRINVDLHYNPLGVRGEPRYVEGVCRITKLHGSLDWVFNGRDIRRVSVPFGHNEPSFLRALYGWPGFPSGTEGASAHPAVIFPNSLKDRETAQYPYVDLFRDFAAAICRPQHTLFVYGYSFGDDHINRVIRDMLTIPSTHLVVIARGDESGALKQFYGQIQQTAKVTLLVGCCIGNLEPLVENYLPQPINRRLIEEIPRHGVRGDGTSKEKRE